MEAAESSYYLCHQWKMSERNVEQADSVCVRRCESERAGTGVLDQQECSSFYTLPH